MSQHKKKPTKHELQKLTDAQHRHEFFRKMKHIIDTCCGPGTFATIPHKSLIKVYSFRSTTLIMRLADDKPILREILKDAKVVFAEIIKKESLRLTTCNLDIGLNDFFSVVSTIITLQMMLSDKDLPEAKKLKEKLSVFPSDEETYNAAHKRLMEILHAFAIGDCEIDKKLVWYKYEVAFSEITDKLIKNYIDLHAEIPPQISVEIEGNRRPATRVGWAFAYEGVRWVSLRPSLFNTHVDDADKPLDVYIQSHAVLRLAERVDCFTIGVIHFNLYHSLAEPKVCYDTHRNVLIEYIFFGIKVGYLRADIVQGVMVIRTFLFITNTGTPEGTLLEKNTGLQKLDNHYFGLDKLSTFMTSDIGKNEKVRKILTDAGCGCLLDLFEKMQPLLTMKTDKLVADVLLKYIDFKESTIVPLEERLVTKLGSV